METELMVAEKRYLDFCDYSNEMKIACASIVGKIANPFDSEERLENFRKYLKKKGIGLSMENDIINMIERYDLMSIFNNFFNNYTEDVCLYEFHESVKQGFFCCRNKIGKIDVPIESFETIEKYFAGCSTKEIGNRFANSLLDNVKQTSKIKFIEDVLTKTMYATLVFFALEVASVIVSLIIGTLKICIIR